jgi:cyclophilin family peptidyl-prolyl cis-trans isomerase
VVGEALFSFGRFTEGRDVAPAARWVTSANDDVRWRAAWALFRPRNPAALPHLLTLSSDPSAEVRFWSVRGLAAEVVDRAEIAGITRAITSARLRAAVTDSDRRVRTEAIRALGGYDDDESVKMLRAAVDDPDSWMSVSAAEGVASVEARSAAAAAAAEAGAEAGRGGRQGGRGQGAGAGRGGRQGGGGQRPAVVREARPDADYRRLVLDWIVPAYNGAPNPRAVWTTPKGEIELELYPGEAPFGTEEFLRLTESGAIVGTVFSRVVPNFVAQQATITGANRLRDEVTRLGLTRGNLAWASGGLDTGRPGYTLGSTPQAHNEGDFTTLGRVVRGMDVVDRLEQGDAVTAARIVR